MPPQQRHARVWIIWGLLGSFAALQAIAWAAAGIPRRPAALAQVIAAWIVMVILAVLAARRIGSLTHRIREHEHTHAATLSELEQLQTQNAMLEVLARSADVTLAVQALASRIARLVPCDRVGLALISEGGQEFQTFTARVEDAERRTRPRPEVVFKLDHTLLAQAVRTREPIVINAMADVSADYLDANVLFSSGFHSIMVVPLISKGRVVGALNLIARAPDAFDQRQATLIQPIAELFAVGIVAQQLQLALGRYRSMEAMSDLTLSVSAEINSALQTIVGHCDLLERGYPDPALQRDLATVIAQAQRIAGLLERMRNAALDRMREVQAAVSETQDAIPTSPEGFEV